MIATSMPEVKLFDIVRLGGGSQMVVTEIKPKRPANPFVGILVNGQGAQYKFGPKHHPVVIGHANPDHPALVAMKQRRGMLEPRVEPVNQEARAVIFHLLEAVEADDMAKAKILTAAIRTMDQFHK